MNRLEYLETLVQYVQHLKGCKFYKHKPCTCGLSEKIASFQQDVAVVGNNVTLAQSYHGFQSAFSRPSELRLGKNK